MGKVLGFRRGKTPWHKTELKDVVAIYDKDPRTTKDAKREIFQVKTWDRQGNPSALYPNTAWRVLVIFAKWRTHRVAKYFKTGWQKIAGGENVGHQKNLR